MRPAGLQRRIVFIRIEIGIIGGRKRAKDVRRDHLDDLRIHVLSEHIATTDDVLQQFVQAGSLDLFALQIGHWIHKVEHDAALSQFADEQLLLIGGWSIFWLKSERERGSEISTAFPFL